MPIETTAANGRRREGNVAKKNAVVYVIEFKYADGFSSNHEFSGMHGGWYYDTPAEAEKNIGRIVSGHKNTKRLYRVSKYVRVDRGRG